MIKLAAVGCGGIMQEHYRRLAAMDGVAFVGHCDSNGDAAKGAARLYGGKAYAHHAEMYDEARPDAVYVCAPPYTRGDIEVAAADRGIHLFIEKPIALDRATADRVAAAVRKHKVLACVGYCYRYCDTIAKARQYLKGRVVSLVNGHCLGGLPDTWWWRQRKCSGGQFLEQTTHAVDLIRYLCGEVAEVFGLASTGCMTKMKDYDIDDSSAVILRLKSGATAAITSTCVNGRHNRFGLEIITPDATMEFDGATLHLHEERLGITHESATDMYREENEAFLDALRTGKRTRIKSTYNDARRTLSVTLAANESMASGLPVKP